jgi:hypothetical protein
MEPAQGHCLRPGSFSTVCTGRWPEPCSPLNQQAQLQKERNKPRLFLLAFLRTVFSSDKYVIAVVNSIRICAYKS